MLGKIHKKEEIMKIKPLLSLSLITILGFCSVVVNEKASLSQETLEFKCAKVYEIDAREKIPTTVIWIPEEKKNVPMIFWKSENITNWSPDARCDTVSPKFDQAFREGRLNYITTGEVNNYNVVCAIAKEGQICNSKNQLFTINPTQNPEAVLTQMAGFFKGNLIALYQSGGKTYIKIDLEKVAQQQGVEIEE